MRTRTRPFVSLGALALIAAGGPTKAGPQEDSASVAQTCIFASGIHHTTVLDDRNILFVMRNHTAYRNTLLGTCPGLNAEKRFMYGHDQLNTLCQGNVINVLSYSFGEVTRGASCWLGVFEPLGDDAVEALMVGKKPGRRDAEANRRVIKEEPVELPPAAPSAPSSADAPVPPPTAEPAPTVEPGR